MAQQRTYSRGTVAALVSLCRGSCYYPSCGAPIVRFVRGNPVRNLQIAHIRALNKGGPRYDSTLTIDQRNTYTNLIFLCEVHHQEVDKLHPGDYPSDLLEE